MSAKAHVQPVYFEKFHSNYPNVYKSTSIFHNYPNSRAFSTTTAFPSDASVAEQLPSILDCPENTPRICIVGSGPSAFYTAKYILQTVPECRIHIIERLPIPFGLVRHGIAPDHPEAKAVTNDFTKSVIDDPRVTLVCNVDVGADMSLADLQQTYNAVILAVGASGSRSLGIPGEDSPGVLDARHIVAWYNGHPDYSTMLPLRNAKRVVIVGNGNVSLDVARIILATPSVLVNTDIPLPVRAELDKHTVSSVHICARKPVTGAAWTIAELREILTMLTRDGGRVEDPLELSHDISSWRQGSSRAVQYHLHIHGASVDPEDPAMAARPIKRKTELLMGTAGTNVHWHSGHGTEGEREAETAIGVSNGVEHRHLHLHFGTTPTEVLTGEGPLTDALLVHARASGDNIPEMEVPIPSVGVDAGRVLVVKSIGYRTLPVEGAPIDPKRHVIPTVNGRVPDCAGVYAVGWASRGPTGIVGTHIGEARALSGVVAEDVSAAGESHAKKPTKSLSVLWGGLYKAVVGREGWTQIDAAERELGQRVGVQGREGWLASVKLSSWEEQVNASRK